MNTSSTTLTAEQEIAQLRAENERLRVHAAARAANRGLSFKVSDKGGLSVYGMGRFPVTLYREQWDRLFAHADEIKLFILANAGGLKLKAEAEPKGAEAPPADKF